MSLVADYGSDSDSESEKQKEENIPVPAVKKSGIFSSLPPPKHSKETSSKESVENQGETESHESGGKKKISFTVPINVESLKKRKDDAIEPDAGERPTKKATTSSTLSFLPAPKNDYIPEKPKEPIVQEEIEKTGNIKEPIKKSVSTKPAPKRIPLSFKQNPIASLLQNNNESSISQSQEPPQEEEETTPPPTMPPPPEPYFTQSKAPSPQVYPNNYPSSESYPQQPYADPYSQSYPQPYTDPYLSNYGYPQTTQYAQPYNSQFARTEHLPRNFRDVKNANIREIRQDEMKKDFPKYRDPDLAYEQRKPSGDIIPDKSQRRQGHISYLLWNMQQNETEMQVRKAQSSKNKRESRARYGW